VKLVAYVRTSTRGGNGDSLAAQEDACRRWAEAEGHEVMAVQRDDGVSGGKPVDERPGLAAALVAIEAGDGDGILVHNVDRLARELHVQEAALDRAWRAGGRVFETFDGEIARDDPDDPQRTFLRQVLGAAAQLERGLIRARLARGRRRKRERGGYTGGPRLARPFGWRLETRPDGKREYTSVPEERAALEKVRAEYDAGASLATVADRLNAAGVRTTTGGRWSRQAVATTLRREGVELRRRGRPRKRSER
jgi:DNA invertase Pin-like site-specific DNA recombinase